MATQSYAGLGTKGIGLGNPAHEGDVLSALGGSVFGSSGLGSLFSHLLEKARGVGVIRPLI